MIITGSYQGIPIFDGEYPFRNGIEPSRGWVRMKLSDLGGQLPNAANALQVEKLIIRGTAGQGEIAQVLTSFSPPNGVDTTSSSVGKPPEEQHEGLSGPHGVLVMHTEGEAEEIDSNTTDVTLPNIFWTEAIIEKRDPSTGEGVVKIELTDERVLWGLGGTVSGKYNWILNDVEKGAAGKLFQWNPKAGALTITEVGIDVADIKDALPILDGRYIEKTKSGGYKPWELYELLLIIGANLPGPPLLKISQALIRPADAGGQSPDVTTGAVTLEGQIVPININWGAQKLAKRALKEMMDRYSFTVVPQYVGGFTLMPTDQEASADAGQPGGLAEGGSVIDPLNEIDQRFHDPSNVANRVMTVPYKPCAVEVCGGRIYEEIACPDWMPVIREDGKEDASDGFGKVGRWVSLDAWLTKIGYSIDKASISLIANYDKPHSKAFSDIPPGNDDKELTRKRQRMMHQHFMRSFMIAPGPFRQFLPMILKRPQVIQSAAGLTGSGIGQSARFFVDGFDPEEIRVLGGGPFWKTSFLELIDPAEISEVDHVHGVITFRKPRGKVAMADKYSFEGQTRLVEAVLSTEMRDWKGATEELAQTIAEWVDSTARSAGDFSFKDVHHIARAAMNKFLSEHGGMDNFAAENELTFDEKTIGASSASIEQLYQELLPMLGEKLVEGAPEKFNITECKLVLPRILGIWAWERDWGRSDDYYRFRGGTKPGAPPYPLENKDLRMYIDITGASNKEAIDALAKIQIDEFLDARDKAIEGDILKFAGFHKIAMSGTMNEVVWRMSQLAGPRSTTECHKSRYLHGIAGRPATVPTWQSASNPLRPQ